MAMGWLMAAAVPVAGASLVACSALLDIGDLPGLPPDAATDRSVADTGSAKDTAAGTDGSTDSQTSATDAGFDGTQCDAQTINQDPANCGTCGHDCQGGECVGGKCQPVLVAISQTGVGAVAVGGNDVYWTIPGAIEHCAIDGGCDGGGGEGFANASNAGGPIALDVANVYWATSDGVQSCSRQGGCVPTTLVSDAGVPVRFALDSANIYWTEILTGRVMRAAKTADAGPPTALATAESSPWGVATDGNRVYWTDQYGAAKYCSVNGCPGTGPALIGASDGARDIVVSAGTVYWSTMATPSIVSCPSTGCTGNPVPYASTSNAIGGIVLADSSQLFWAGGTSTSIYECAQSGCTTPKPLIALTQVGSMALDAHAVYWTDGMRVMRVAK